MSVADYLGMVRGHELRQRETAQWVVLLCNHWRDAKTQLTVDQLFEARPARLRTLTGADIQRQRETFRQKAEEWRASHGR